MVANLRLIAVVVIILLAAAAFGSLIHDGPSKQDPCIVNVGGGPGPEWDNVCD